MNTLTSYLTQPALTLFGAFLLFSLPSPAQKSNAGAEAQTLSSLGTTYTLAFKGSGSRYFTQTGKTVSGDFLQAFDKDGLAQIGYPISDETVEGNLRVQYFERARMEYHPELSGSSATVQLTRLGAQLSATGNFQQVQPFASTPGTAYFQQTKHSLAIPFLEYWSKNGGVDVFGYPISEPETQNGLYVQWFERARMEYHPEKKDTAWAVQLTQLGNIVYGKAPSSVVQQVATNPNNNTGISAQESQLLDLINSKRANTGAMPITVLSPLVDTARGRSQDMAQRNYFSHVTPEGHDFTGILHDRQIAFSFAGEAIARNNTTADKTVQLAMDTFMNSPAHKAILLDPQFDYVGTGYALAGDGMSYFTVIVLRR